jgi:hypothetical protein
MNERVPDSSGLPLRAMVMVLLFLGVIFLLVGFQAMSSGNDAADDPPARTLMTTTTAAPVPKADVRVYSVSGNEPAAVRVSDRLKEAGWNVTVTATSTVAELPATTVYFGAAEGEQAAADAIGKVLEAPVQPRIPEIAEDPPGVIVLVTG